MGSWLGRGNGLLDPPAGNPSSSGESHRFRHDRRYDRDRWHLPPISL